MNRLLSNGYKLLYCNGLGLMYGFIDLDHITHYLMFSVKINTDQLNGHFNQRVLYLEKEVSRMVMGGGGRLVLTVFLSHLLLRYFLPILPRY